MGMLKGLAKTGMILSMAATLAACGGAPSEADVRKAFDEGIAEQMAMLSAEQGTDVHKMLVGIMPTIDIVSLESCEPAEKGVYLCLVEAKITLGGRSTVTRDTVGLKKNTSGDWKIMQ